MPNINNIKATWSNIVTTFTAIKMNVTDTASAADSKIVDLLVDDVSKFSIGKDGAITSSDPLSQPNLYDDVASLVASTRTVVGDIVETLGYNAVGDGGGGIYEIVSAATGTADGGSFIDLTGITGQAELQHNNFIKAEQWGVQFGVESSAAWQAAMYFAADLAPTTRQDTENAVTFSCETTVLTKNILHITKTGGGVVSYMTVFHPAKIELDDTSWDASSGDLSGHTDDAPLPIINSRMRRAPSYWGEVDCKHRCAGIRYSSSGRHLQHFMDVHSWRRYGQLVLDSSNNALRIIDNNCKQWLLGDTGDYPLTPGGTIITGGADNPVVYDGDCFVACQKDFLVTGGTFGWSKSATLTLDVTGRRSNTAGEDIYYDGMVEPGDSFYHSANRVSSAGCGDVIFQNVHVMQGFGEGATSPRIDNIANGGPASIVNYNTSNACYFLGGDIDASTVQLYGDSMVIDKSSLISGGTNTQSDRVIVIDPRIRVYRNGNGADFGGLDFTGVNNATVGFYAGDGGALTGDYTEWNIVNRPDSGTYTGLVTFIDFFDASGGVMPDASATAGDFWIVSVAGTVGAQSFVQGEYVYALINTPGSSWNASNWKVTSYSDVVARSDSYTAQVIGQRYNVVPRDSNNDIEKWYKPGGNFNQSYDTAGVTYSWQLAEVGGKVTYDAVQYRWDLQGTSHAWVMLTDGRLRPVEDNVVNIGASGSRVATVYSGNLNLSDLPTSAGGLNAGDIWNNSGVLNIA